MHKKIKLKNKATLILAPKNETKAVTVLVIFKIGSRYESKKENGLSHFIEHMMFKGTKKRPNTIDISRELDSVGAEFNAFTSKDYTGYYIKIQHKKIELALDILSDILFNSKFEKNEFEKEKGVIIEEINMYKDNPLMHMEEYFEQVIYGSSALGRFIAGPKENIKSFKRKDLVSFKNKFYHPKNMSIGVAGRFSEKKIKSLAEKYFSSKNKKPLSKFKKYRHQQKKRRVKINYKETDQVQMALGFPAFSYFHKDIYVLYLLGIILGGSMSSRLFINIRERKGLCYFIRSTPNIYEDTGNLFIQAGLDKRRIFQALKLIWQELKNLKYKGVKSKELKKAKEFLKGKMILSMEDSSQIASYFTKQFVLTGKVESPEEKIKKIEKVKTSDIKRVVGKIIKKKRLNLAIIGPFRDKAKFEKFIDQKLK
ncbi:MAG: pitrilysin family protein [Patescibacteria group bacterium]|nr:pitrilysin family protein [Patescibacteria group bacterium]